MNNKGDISVGTEKLHYISLGSGSRLLLAFHGYANDATIFSPLEKYLQNDYTIISFNLPHHGSSTWGNTMLTKQHLVEIVEKLKKEYSVNKISLIGYSLGGRICFTILELMPATIDRVTLLASDGLAVNFYYHFFTRNWIGKKLFRHMLTKPTIYFKLMDWLKNRNLVNTSRHRFVMQSLGTPENRNFLLRVWPGLSDLIPDPAKLKAAILQYHIPVTIFMGAHDKIMPPALAEKFKTGLDTVQLYILDKGHRIFDNETAPQIAHSLL